MENTLQILVIADDDSADRLLLKMAIEEVGLTAAIIEKTDGKEALHFFENECSILQPSLIILDINMPVYSGFEVLEFAQNNPSLCTTPVIVFSTSMATGDEIKSRALGASRFVSKPTTYPGYLRFARELKDFLIERNKKNK